MSKIKMQLSLHNAPSKYAAPQIQCYKINSYDEKKDKENHVEVIMIMGHHNPACPFYSDKRSISV